MSHAIPWFSAFTAFTEVLVTAAVVYVLYMAIVKDQFKGGVLAVALAYEVLFNITYMTARLFTHTEPAGTHHADWMIWLLAGHGSLSLVMFIGLVWMSVLAFRRDREGKNFFASHATLTWSFLGLWMVSILSGEAIFMLEYVGHY